MPVIERPAIEIENPTAKDPPSYPVSIIARHETAMRGTFASQHLAFRWEGECLADKDASSTGAYKGLGMRKLWATGMGRTSGGGISGKLWLHGGVGVY